MTNPLSEVRFSGISAYYIRMWRAKNMGIDPITFKKMNDDDIGILMKIENEMALKNKRASKIMSEMNKMR